MDKNVESNLKVKNHIAKEDAFYISGREKTMTEYLKEVGNISKFINKKMVEIHKSGIAKEK